MAAAKSKETKKNIFARVGGAVAGFFKGISCELKKVTWPTKKELFKMVLSVLIVCVVIGGIIFGIDTLLQLLVDWIR